MTNELPAMTEGQIMTMEDEIYRKLCANNLNGEVAAWLSITHSLLLRLNNQVREINAKLDKKRKPKGNGN